MQHGIVEGEPGIFPAPVAKVMRAIGGLFNRKSPSPPTDTPTSPDASSSPPPSGDPSAPASYSDLDPKRPTTAPPSAPADEP
jgi:hypothetical protein